MTQTYDFPGGPVTIDEGKVWRALSDWLADAPGRDARMWKSAATGAFMAALLPDLTVNVGGIHGRSMLGFADAVAQALQTATRLGLTGRAISVETDLATWLEITPSRPERNR
jgi:hypothetical protein